MSPPSSNDITKSFIALLRKNGAIAKEKGRTPWYETYSKLKWFKGMVKNNALWDLKNKDYKGFQKTGVDVCGVHYKCDMTGNFHYGFVGAAAEIYDFVLHEAAGYAQNRAGTSKPSYHCTADDDPRDYEFIRLGIQLFNKFGLHFSQENLKSVLKGFSPKTCRMFTPRSLGNGDRIRHDGIIVSKPRM